MLHYYYGNGKGKSSSANGQILRAHAHDWSFQIFRFFKQESGEDKIFQSYTHDSVHFLSFDKWIDFKNISKTEKIKIDSFIVFSKNLIKKTQPDIVLFDEIAYLFEYNLLKTETILNWMKQEKQKREMIITGHSPVADLINMADYCTEFQKIKHPYPNVQARIGIEF